MLPTSLAEVCTVAALTAVLAGAVLLGGVNRQEVVEKGRKTLVAPVQAALDAIEQTNE